MESTVNSSKKYADLEGRVSIIVNTLLFGIKFYAGKVSCSVALQADAWHTLSDTVSSVFVLIGAYWAVRPPDEEHPFGHGRAELLTALGLGMFLGFIAYEFGRESIVKLLSRGSAQYGPIAVAATIVSILVKEGLAQFAFWTYRKSGSQALKADGQHHRSDALSSVLVLVGIVFSKSFWWIDGLLGIGVALAILYMSVQIVMEAVHPLLGTKLDDSTAEKIGDLCSTVYGSHVGTHHFHIHEYGDHSELTFHLVLPAEVSLQHAHELANRIEDAIRKTYQMEATIHMEPQGAEKDFTGEGGSPNETTPGK